VPSQSQGEHDVATTKTGLQRDPTDPNALPPWSVAVPLGLQHVLAMFTSNLTPAILLAGVVGATTGEATLLVQAALLCAGLATLLQTVGIGPVGSRLPLMMGAGFAFIAVAVPLAADYGLSAVLGGVLVTAVVQVLIGLNIHRVAQFFPPVVTGTIILVIGLGLLPSGVNLAAGGIGSPDFGSPANLAVAAVVLVLTVVLNQFGRGLLSSAAVLIAVLVGYVVAIPFGLLDLSGVGDEPLVAVPTPFEFGVSFPLVAVLSMAVVGVVNMVDSVGTVHAVTEGGAGRPATTRELRGGILAEGGSAVLGGVFGALPTTMFSQNIGLVALTKQMSRHVVTIGACVLVGLALLPQLAAVLATRPVKTWHAEFDAAGVPTGPINDFADVFADPQIVHREMRMELPHSQIGSVPQVANPVRFSATPIQYGRAAPLLGEHTDEVLKEVLKLDDDGVAALRRDKVV